jgi:hypothetical protein
VSDSAPQQQQPFIYRFPAPLLIAGASAAGYWLAHAYESAYLAHFGLSNGLVRVGLNSAIIATGALLSVAVGALFSTAMITAGLEKDGVGYNIEVITMVGVFFLLVYDRMARPGLWRSVLHLTIAAAAVLLTRVGVRAYREWATKRKKPDAAGRGWVNPFQSIVVPWIGWEAFTIAWLLSLAHTLAGIVGTEAARRETRFLTVQDPAGFVILRTYDEALIAASLNREAHTVGPGVAILSPRSGVLVAKYEEVGPLTRASPPPPPPAHAQPPTISPSPPSPGAQALPPAHSQ